MITRWWTLLLALTSTWPLSALWLACAPVLLVALLLSGVRAW